MRYALAAVLLLAGVVAADMPRSPELPKLTKKIEGRCRVTLGPGVSGWVFVTSTTYSAVWNNRPVGGTSRAQVELSEAKPVDLSTCTLYAIPAELAKVYPTTDELMKAVEEKSVAGVHSRRFEAASVEVPKWQNRSPQTNSFTITAIDDTGIHVAETTVADTPDGKPKASGPLIPGGWCAGFAAAVGVTAGGLWLARRRGRR